MQVMTPLPDSHQEMMLRHGGDQLLAASSQQHQ